MILADLLKQTSFKLHLLGAIDKDSLKKFVDQYILFQDNASGFIKYDRGLLFINSSGGDSDAASGIIDLLEMSKYPIDAFVLGQCKSAGMRVLQYCEKRYSTKRTRFMIHESGSYFDKSDYIPFGKVQSTYSENKFTNDRLLYDVFHRSNLKDDIDKQSEIAQKETYLNPDQCLELGLIDEIIK